MTLPNLELKYTKVNEKHEANTNTNSLSNSNTIIIKDLFGGGEAHDSRFACGDKKSSDVYCPPTSSSSLLNPSFTEPKSPKIVELQKSSSLTNIERSETPLNVKQFKETFLSILISYFKNNIVLLNNLVELSDKIITKVSDLTLLISLLLNISQNKIDILVEEISSSGCCGKICRQLPRYRKINDIIIDKKQSFKVSYNQFYIQLQTEFNISLDFVLL
jgi:hypothetical protein